MYVIQLREYLFSNEIVFYLLILKINFKSYVLQKQTKHLETKNFAAIQAVYAWSCSYSFLYKN